MTTKHPHRSDGGMNVIQDVDKQLSFKHFPTSKPWQEQVRQARLTLENLFFLSLKAIKLIRPKAFISSKDCSDYFHYFAKELETIKVNGISCTSFPSNNQGVQYITLHQRGPTTGPQAACGPRMEFVWNLCDRITILYKQRQLFFEERYDFGTKKELRRSIPVEDLFFREHPEFGTKIGILEIDIS